MTADRIADATEEFHVRAARIGRAHADPREMRGQIVPAFLARHTAGLRLLVKQMQAFVAGKEIDPLQLARMHAHQAFHEADGFADLAGHAAVLFGHGRVFHPIQIPIIEARGVHEAAAHQRANEVQREGGAFIAAQHEPRIGRAGGFP